MSDDGVNDEGLSREKMQIVTVRECINANLFPSPYYNQDHVQV